MRQQYSIDLNNAEWQNIFPTSEGLVVRDAFYTIDEDNFLAGQSIVRNDLTYHYVLYCPIGTRGLKLRIYETNWQVISDETVAMVYNKDAPICIVSVNNQIIINGPGISTPLWGYVGSSVIPAVPNPRGVDDVLTSSLQLYPGLVCKFADRIVWSINNQVIISDPPTGETEMDPKQLSPNNSIAFAGTITDIFESTSTGSLIVVTTAGVSILPAAGLVGTDYAANLNFLATYQSQRFGNAASSCGRTYGLSKNGVIDFDSGKEIPLTTYRRNRFFSSPVGPGRASDYRFSKIFAYEDGFIISTPEGPCCFINCKFGTYSWVVDDTYIPIVKGVLRTGEGELALLLRDGLVDFYGTQTNLKGTFACDVVQPGINSNCVTNISVTVEGNGINQVVSYVKNSNQTSVVPSASGAAVTTSSVWGTANLLEVEYRSRNNHKRGGQGWTDGIYCEVGAIGSGIKVQSAVLETNTQTPQRRTS